MNPEVPARSLLGDSLRAHLLMFPAPLAPAYPPAAGARMLLAFVAVALGLVLALRYGFAAVGFAGTPVARLAFIGALLICFVVVQRGYVRLPFADTGLRGWGDWSRRERLYLFQVVPLAAVAFTFVFRTHLAALLAAQGLAGFLLFSVATGLLWGAVQELLYRSWLQTELSRRFGALAGLLVANLVFTFGPLHWDHLAAGRWGVLAAVFAIGALFGLLYRRSGNLWLPAILHGLWPLNMQ